MKNKLDDSRDRASLLHVPTFGTTPPPRCFASPSCPPFQACGEIATVRRRGNQVFPDTFFCDKHRDETDVAIAGEFIVRRVRVTCGILMAGVEHDAGECQVEAVARLEAAVHAAGGVLCVDSVHSSIGRYPASFRSSERRPAAGKG